MVGGEVPGLSVLPEIRLQSVFDDVVQLRILRAFNVDLAFNIDLAVDVNLAVDIALVVDIARVVDAVLVVDVVLVRQRVQMEHGP